MAWKPRQCLSLVNAAVYVDDKDTVWITEWTSNAIMRFDPRSQKWDSFPSTARCGKCWGGRARRGARNRPMTDYGGSRKVTDSARAMYAFGVRLLTLDLSTNGYAHVRP